MNRQVIVRVLRELRLLDLADKVYSSRAMKRHVVANRNFMAAHPDVAMPPDDLLYEIMGGCSYGGYWGSGINDANWLTEIIRGEKTGGTLHVAEWGCGPARVLRHIKNADRSFKCYGFDCDRKAIEWCRANVSDCTFFCNSPAPPLEIAANSLDVLYCLSVFTHLSERMHYEWIGEIWRVLKPGGLFIGTFHSDRFKNRLLPDELRLFNSGGCVVRDKVLEGSRNYSAYQSAPFLEKTLFKGFIGVKEVVDLPFHQNIWCATKPDDVGIPVFD